MWDVKGVDTHSESDLLLSIADAITMETGMVEFGCRTAAMGVGFCILLWYFFVASTSGLVRFCRWLWWGNLVCSL